MARARGRKGQAVTVAPPDSAQGSGDTRLIPSYTFEEFVIGPHNRFPHAAALAVSENLGKAYNPLFIYGPVGIGKTHLMQAVGHRVLQRDSKTRVLYVTAQQFMSEVIELLQAGNLNALRERYRALDLLLVDDIQFLATSEATQEEFFHMFNDLHSAGKQIIMTSDRPPKMLTTLEDRLRSRFEWGLIADIKHTNLETRVAILRKKEGHLKGVRLADDIRIYIASRLKSNIRELEGFLRRVQAYSQLNNQDVTLVLVKEIMKELLPPEEWVDDPVVEEPAPMESAPAPAEEPAPLESAPAPAEPEAALESLPAAEPPIEARPSVPEEGAPGLALPEVPSEPETPAPLGQEFDNAMAGIGSSLELGGGDAPAEAPMASAAEAPGSSNFVKGEDEQVVAVPSNPGDIPVVFFFPTGKEKELGQMKKKFGDIIRKHKLKFSLFPALEVPYPMDSSLSYELFSTKCKRAGVMIAVVLGPSPDGTLGEAVFFHRLQELFEQQDLSLQLIPWDELAKDYRFLNLALDITLLRIKQKGKP
ncbi:MAG: chromosomal replication initiator protein DnaA [Elusimicrobia bacterium]|nr:chromosomal replication initiator protein DnaA [Elusimicrobiota bacterium]